MNDKNETTNHDAESLRRRLIALNVSQQQVAEATGVAQTTISRFQRGETDVRVSTFIALSRFVADREQTTAAK